MQAGERSAREASGFRYDTDLIKADSGRLLAAYLNHSGRISGKRLVWDCPRCGKKNKLSLQRASGAVGCMNAACEVPESTDVLGLIGHLEGLRTQGTDFRQIGALCYRLLGLPDPQEGALAADGTDAAARADGKGTPPQDAAAGRQRAAPATPLPEEHPPAPPEAVGRVLGRLLELCPLEERDTRVLAARGVSEETARDGRFGSISKSRAAHVVRRLAEEFGRDELLGVPGFREDTDRGGRLGFTLWGDFLLIPYVGPDGRIATVEGRAVGEEVPAWAGKYTSLRNGGNHLYVFPAFSVEDLVAICEGPMGAIVAAQEGLAVGAIQGVKRYMAAGQEAPLPELVGVDFGGRGVLYVPDVDVKPAAIADVEKHAPRACEWLIARQNGVPRIAMLPEWTAADGSPSAAPKDLDEWILAEPGIGRDGILSRLFARSAPPGEWSGIDHAKGKAVEEAAPPGDPRQTRREQAAEELAANGPEEATIDPREAGRPPGTGEARSEQSQQTSAGASEDPDAPEARPSEDVADGDTEGTEEGTLEAPGAADGLDAFERWYAVLEGGRGSKELVAAPGVYRPNEASAGVPSDVIIEDAELQWAGLLGLVAALAVWYTLGAFVGWLPGPFGWLPELPGPLTALAGIPQGLAFGSLVAAAVGFHLRGRRIAARRHLLGEANN